MAENKLTDARVRSATHDRDGAYLSDGGGLRLRLLPASRNHPKGARLAEFHFKVKDAAGAFKHGSLHLGTIGEPFTDPEGSVRAFTLADARRARNEARELVAAGTDPREAARLTAAEHADDHRRKLAALDNRRTVRQAFERWRDLYLSAHHKDGGLSVEQMFNSHVLPAVGDRPLDELRRADITQILDVLTAQGKRRSANMALQMVRQFTRWCLMREWLATDPTFSITKAAAGGRLKPRERVLSPLEIIDLRDKLPTAKLQPRIVHAVWLLLATGARVGELSGAAVAEFDLEARTWQMPETKNGEPHLVHLSDFALEHVRALLKLGKRTAYLLPSRNRGAAEDEPREDRPLVSSSIGKMLHDRQRVEPLKGRTEAAGTLKLARGEWTPHDLRRSMATQMRETLRISSDVVERCLNHKPQGIVAVYQRGELMAERKEAFEAWGVELQRLMSVDASNVVELNGARAAA